MSRILITLATLAVVTAPALADPISQQRASTIQECQDRADAKWGPSGVRDWRRYDHDDYAACMADHGQPE